MSNPFYGDESYFCNTGKAYTGPSGHQYCAKCPCVPSCDLPCPPSVYPNGMNSGKFRDEYGYKNNPALMNLPYAKNKGYSQGLQGAIPQPALGSQNNGGNNKTVCMIGGVLLAIGVIYIIYYIYKMQSKKK